jgi:hypothetical protein
MLEHVSCPCVRPRRVKSTGRGATMNMNQSHNHCQLKAARVLKPPLFTHHEPRVAAVTLVLCTLYAKSSNLLCKRFGCTCCTRHGSTLQLGATPEWGLMGASSAAAAARDTCSGWVACGGWWQKKRRKKKRGYTVCSSGCATTDTADAVNSSAQIVAGGSVTVHMKASTTCFQGPPN